jgi:hypothetical protein
MNATALYFENSMAQESTEIARGLRRRDPDLLDRLIEQSFGRFQETRLHRSSPAKIAITVG